MEALQELRQERAAQLGQRRGPVRDRMGETSIPGFDRDGLLVTLTSGGTTRRIHGTPWLWAGPSGEGEGLALERARRFLGTWNDLWGMGEPGVEFHFRTTKADRLGGTHIVFDETIDGLSVDGLELVVHFDSDGHITGVNGAFLPSLNDPAEPTVTLDEALETAWQSGEWALDYEDAELVVLSPDEIPADLPFAILAWKLTAQPRASAPHGRVAYVDAHTGALVHAQALVPAFGQYDIDVEDCDGSNDIDDCTVRRSYRNGVMVLNDTCSVDCSHAADWAIDVWDTWDVLLDREGYSDNSDSEIMRLSIDYQNYAACDSGATAWAIYQGMRTAYNVGTVSNVDLVAHENGHILQQYEIGVGGSMEPGAVGEHFADVNDIWVEGHTGTQDWELGWYCSPGTYAFSRSYQDPPSGGGDQGPDSWRWYMPCKSSLDHGCTHANAGVLNKMAYMLHRRPPATTTFNGITVAGIGNNAGAMLFYTALNGHYFGSGSGLHDYRDGLIAACAYYYGATSSQCEALDDAWNAVGLWSPERQEAGSIVGRPAAYSWQGWGGYTWLYVFYRGSDDKLKWRWVNAESGLWGAEQSVSVGSTTFDTDAPPAVAPWQGYLYVYYKVKNSNDIRYLRMNTSETFYGSYGIPSALAQTDRGLAAVTTNTTNYVVFREAGASNHVKMVSRTLWTWQASPTSPLWTDSSPAATAYTYSDDEDLLVFVKHPDQTIRYAAFDGSAGQWDANATMEPVGAREFNEHPPGDYPDYDGWSYGTPKSSEGPSVVEWGAGPAYFTAHKGKSSSSIWMQMRGEPYDAPGTRRWSPQPRQPGLAASAPTLVKTDTPGGLPWALYMIHEGDGSGHHIWWMSSRGGN